MTLAREKVVNKNEDKDANSMKNKNSNSLILFEKEFSKWRFYQKAKRLVGHPADKCLTKDPLLMKFFVICERRNLLAQPLFIEILKN